jgi:hypothetical protein
MKSIPILPVAILGISLIGTFSTIEAAPAQSKAVIVSPIGGTSDTRALERKIGKTAEKISLLSKQLKQTNARVNQIAAGMATITTPPPAPAMPGLAGSKGEKGEPGAPGLKGDKGDKGERGLTGLQGLKGDKGDAGALGQQGLKGDKGERGDRGDKGDRGDRGADGTSVDTAAVQRMVAQAVAAVQPGSSVTNEQVKTIVANTLFDARDLPALNVTYQPAPALFSDGVNKYAATAEIRFGSTGEIQHRIILRKGDLKDPMPHLGNSPIVFDSGIKNDAAYEGSRFELKKDNLHIWVWLAKVPKSDFPVLRAMVGNAQTRVIANCAQGVINSPFSRNVSYEVPTPGQGCSFGARVSYGVASFNGLGITLNSGIRLAADDSTIMKVCQHNGFQGAALVTATPFSSCTNNTIVKWVNGNWDIVNACAFNSGLSALTCFKLER